MPNSPGLLLQEVSVLRSEVTHHRGALPGFSEARAPIQVFVPGVCFSGTAAGTEVERRYSEGGTPTCCRKKRVKLLCAEKPSSAETSAILPCPEESRAIAVSTQS